MPTIPSVRTGLAGAILSDYLLLARASRTDLVSGRAQRRLKEEGRLLRRGEGNERAAKLSNIRVCDQLPAHVRVELYGAP